MHQLIIVGGGTHFAAKDGISIDWFLGKAFNHNGRGFLTIFPANSEIFSSTHSKTANPFQIWDPKMIRPNNPTLNSVGNIGGRLSCRHHRRSSFWHSSGPFLAVAVSWKLTVVVLSEHDGKTPGIQVRKS